MPIISYSIKTLKRKKLGEGPNNYFNAIVISGGHELLMSFAQKGIQVQELKSLMNSRSN